MSALVKIASQDASEVKNKDNFSDQLKELAKEAMEIKEVSKELMAIPLYAKNKEEGIFQILMAARRVGMDPIHALNGGLNIIEGKVAMPSESMNALVRRHGHSIKKDDASNERKCVVKGVRKNNGDFQYASFSIEEAKAAGLTNKNNWKNYPQAMLFARAASMLCKQLFPDVIAGMYTVEEMEDVEFLKNRNAIDVKSAQISSEERLSDLQIIEIENYFSQMPDMKERILSTYRKIKTEDLHPSNWDFMIGWLERESGRRTKPIEKILVEEPKKEDESPEEKVSELQKAMDGE